ncbi:hypothetical protein FZ615_04670 [Staphylococcus pseudintermedius]|nr:hypothetical protein [Staphylococcus pseudintermedius]
MKKRIELKRASWILEDINQRIINSDCIVSLHSNTEEYKAMLEYIELDVDIEILNVSFFVVEKIGTDLYEVVITEDVKNPEDLLSLFEERDYVISNDFTNLIYVSSKKYKEFKKIIKEEFSRDFSKSPFSLSAYNSTDISWGHKPDGSLRVADHWNFESRQVLHCPTVEDIKDELAIARYNVQTKKYELIFRNGYEWDVTPVKVTEDGIIFLEDEVSEYVA